MASGNFVTGLNLTLCRNEDFNHFQNAGQQIVAALYFLDLVVKVFLDSFQTSVKCSAELFDFGHNVFIFDDNLAPLRRRLRSQNFFGNRRVLGNAFRSVNHDLPQQHFFQTCIKVSADNRNFVITVFGQMRNLFLLNGQGSFILLNAATGENMYVNDNAFDTRLNAQRRVADIGRLFAKDGAQQFFFRCYRRFAFRRNLADQNVAGLDFGTDVNDACLIQITQSFFADVRDVAGNLFLTKFGIAGHHFKFFNMQRSEDVVAGNAFGQQNGILVVQTVPRHKSNQNVLAQSQFAHVGTRTVGHNVAGLDFVADLNQRHLVNAGVLVRAAEFLQLVNFNAHIGAVAFLGTNHNTVGVNRVDDTVILGNHGRAGILGDGSFHAGTDQRGFRTQQGHALTLHVRTHQRTVRVVVFQERNQSGRNRNQLLRRNVNEVDLFRMGKFKLAGLAAGNQIVFEMAVFLDLGVRFRNFELAFLIGGKVNDFFGNHAVDNFAVRTLNKAVFVDAGISRQRVNQTDVRTFRRFNRTDTSVVGRMYVADFKTSTFAGQTAGPQSRQAAFVGNFRQRIILIHKLRQLRRAEELADNRSNRFGVDQILRFDIVQNFRAHSFANGSFHAQQAHAILVLHQFADRTDAAVTEMVNIVYFAFAVAQLDQTFDNAQNIVFAQRPISIRRVIKRDVQRNVHLYAADRRQVIALNVKEQTLKQLIGSFIGRRFTRAHNAIDVKQSLFAAVVFVGFQRVSDIRANINTVDKQGLDFANLGFGNFVKQLLVQFGAGFGDNFAGFAVNHIVGQKLAIHLLLGNAVKFQPFVSQFLCRARRQLFASFQNHVTGLGINQIKVKLDTLHTFGNKLGLPVLLIGNIGVGVIEVIENFLFVHAFDFGAVDFLTVFGQLFNLLFRLL